MTHTYDWTDLADEERLPRARATSPERLRASLARLAALAEDERLPQCGNSLSEGKCY